MKIFFVSVLFFLVSCNNGDNGSSSSKVTPAASTDEQYAKDYIQQSLKTLPPELKLTNQEKSYIKSELSLTVDESQSLDQIQ